jgi:hypothetical protein
MAERKAWHPGHMPGKEIDPIRARSALDVIKQHPGMVLFAASPALVLVGLIWWLGGAGWAIVALFVLLLGGGFALVRKR